jgi:outer membrane protein assembly factor BamA
MRRGHALVQVKERSEVDAAGNSVSLWLDFVAGPLCRIEALEWVGVTKVETTVLSRLMRIHAGDRYDHGLLLEEIGRLRSLGLIMGAQIVTAEGAKPDAVRVRLVGQDAMQKWYPAFTMTYLPGEGAVLLLQLSTPNLLGKGIRFRGSSWLSSERRLFDLSIGVPALLHPLDNLGFEIHNRDRKYPILQAQSRGFSASYGRSLDRRRRWSVFTTLGIDYWDLSSFTASETVAFDEPNVGIQTSYGLSYDDRDSGLLGTRGQRLSLSLQRTMDLRQSSRSYVSVVREPADAADAPDSGSVAARGRFLVGRGCSFTARFSWSLSGPASSASPSAPSATYGPVSASICCASALDWWKMYRRISRSRSTSSMHALYRGAYSARWRAIAS